MTMIIGWGLNGEIMERLMSINYNELEMVLLQTLLGEPNSLFIYLTGALAHQKGI